MLTALVLVCSIALTPDLRDSDQTNARDVPRVPEAFASPASCFMHGQAFLAGTEIGRHLAADERVKVSCSRSATVVARARPATIE